MKSGFPDVCWRLVGGREGERRKLNYLWLERLSHSCRGNWPPSLEGLQRPPEPEATLDSYSCSHWQAQLSLFKSPCLFKKKFSMILQESVCCTSLHDKHFFKQPLFFSLCIWKQHTLSHPISHTLGMKWETSLWLKAPAQGSSARRKPQASSQALHTTKHWGRILRSIQSPSAPAVLSRNSKKPRLIKDTKDFHFYRNSSPRCTRRYKIHQKCNAAAQGTHHRATAGHTGSVWSGFCSPDQVHHCHRSSFHRHFLAKRAVIIAAQ